MHGAPPDEHASALPIVLGLVVLTGLAYLASLPRLRQWERKLGLSQAVSAGLPFVALGFVARRSGVVSETLLQDLGSVLRIALGWTGFLVGLRFRASALARTSREVSWLAVARCAATMALVTAAAAPLMGRLVSGQGKWPSLRINQVLTLGVAACATSFVVPRLLSERGADAELVSSVRRVIQMEELLSIVGLLLVGAYFRSPASGVWPLPGGVWVLLTLGLGAGAGLLANAVLSTPGLDQDRRVLLSLGVVCFTAGAAGYLELSPIVASFLAGSVVGGLPGDRETVLLRTLAPLDHAVTLVLLVFVGTYLDLRDPDAWLLACAFVPARFAGRLCGTWAGARLAGLRYRGDAYRSLVISPLGSLGIAMVVSTHVITPTGALPAISVAVVVTALFTELVMQAALRVPRKQQAARPSLAHGET